MTPIETLKRLAELQKDENRSAIELPYEARSTDFAALADYVRGRVMSLWNKLPLEERLKLIPYQIEAQILHLEQAKALAVRSHRGHIAELNDWINNLKSDLNKESKS